ncbi:MAG: hypothetical protein ACTHM0_14415 [Sphingomonas sp.]
MALKKALEEAHAALLHELAELEEVTAAPEPDAARLAATRLRLSKTSSRRVQLLDKIVAALLDNVSDSTKRALADLRADLAAARARSSEHVVRWPLDEAKRDWAGYREASARMRQAMRAQIDRERATLDPLLGV